MECFIWKFVPQFLLAIFDTSFRPLQPFFGNCTTDFSKSKYDSRFTFSHSWGKIFRCEWNKLTSHINQPRLIQGLGLLKNSWNLQNSFPDLKEVWHFFFQNWLIIFSKSEFICWRLYQHYTRFLSLQVLDCRNNIYLGLTGKDHHRCTHELKKKLQQR